MCSCILFSIIFLFGGFYVRFLRLCTTCTLQFRTSVIIIFRRVPDHSAFLQGFIYYIHCAVFAIKTFFYLFRNAYAFTKTNEQLKFVYISNRSCGLYSYVHKYVYNPRCTRSAPGYIAMFITQTRELRWFCSNPRVTKAMRRVQKIMAENLTWGLKNINVLRSVRCTSNRV